MLKDRVIESVCGLNVGLPCWRSCLLHRVGKVIAEEVSGEYTPGEIHQMRKMGGNPEWGELHARLARKYPQITGASCKRYSPKIT